MTGEVRDPKRWKKRSKTHAISSYLDVFCQVWEGKKGLGYEVVRKSTKKKPKTFERSRALCLFIDSASWGDDE